MQPRTLRRCAISHERANERATVDPSSALERIVNAIDRRFFEKLSPSHAIATRENESLATKSSALVINHGKRASPGDPCRRGGAVTNCVTRDAREIIAGDTPAKPAPIARPDAAL